MGQNFRFVFAKLLNIVKQKHIPCLGPTRVTKRARCNPIPIILEPMGQFVSFQKKGKVTIDLGPSLR